MNFGRFLERTEVDKDPTAANFPRQVWEAKEVLPEYRRYLEPWFRRGIAPEHVLFVPRPWYQPGINEYMLAYLEEELMVLERREDGRIDKSVIKRDDVSCFCSTEDLLKGCITIYRPVRGVNKKTELYYNRVAKALFLPFLNWLACRPDGFDCHRAAEGDAMPRRLKQEELALYNYGKDAYRFGNYGLRWEWRSFRPSGFLKKKKAVKPSCLLCEMEKGKVLVLLAGSRADIWYLFNGRAFASLEDNDRMCRIQISAGNEVIEDRTYRSGGEIGRQ